jgi:hypothetical protein
MGQSLFAFPRDSFGPSSMRQQYEEIDQRKDAPKKLAIEDQYNAM